MFKKYIALFLALIMVFSLAACGDKDATPTTTAKAEDAMANQVTEDNEENTEEVTEGSEEESGKIESEDETEENVTEETEDETTKKSDEEKTTKKSDSKTTTKADKTMKIPSTKAEILNAYKAAANKTKAQKNMEIDKTAKVNIVIDRVASLRSAGAIANSIAGKYMNQWDGKTIMKEVFVNNKPTVDLERTKNTFMPLYGEKEMCTLNVNQITSAKVIKKSKDSYQVEIRIVDDTCGVNDKPPVLAKGMDYFDTRLYGFDAIGLAFLSGTIKYTNAVITATITSDGYIDNFKHEMHLKTTDSKIAYKDFKIPGYVHLHGSYITTFKYY